MSTWVPMVPTPATAIAASSTTNGSLSGSSASVAAARMNVVTTTRWALPDDGRMQRLTRLHELDAGHRGVATRSAWVTDDVTAVAVWEPPDGADGTAALPADVTAALARELPYLRADRASTVAETRFSQTRMRWESQSSAIVWEILEDLKES